MVKTTLNQAGTDQELQKKRPPLTAIRSGLQKILGCDTTKNRKADRKSWPIVKPYYDEMENKQQWCIAAVPGAAWAKKVFPGLPKGRAVEVHAEKNPALLEQMISMDEGAAYLGECALVPVDSPISESGLLFYDTLFDENAACHLALSMGFTNTIRGFEDKTLGECRQMGVNDSMEHNDFMIGYEGLDIDAVTKEGKTVPVSRRGRWAFEV